MNADPSPSEETVPRVQCPHCLTSKIAATLAMVLSPRGEVLRCWQCGGEYALTRLWPDEEDDDAHPSARRTAIGALAIVFSATSPTSEDDRQMVARNRRLVRLVIDCAPDVVLDAALAQYSSERGSTR